jgi:hypothetical protein
MVRSAKDWPWSSYRATAGLAQCPEFLTTDWLLGGFGDDKRSAQLAYRKFVSDGKGQPSPWEQLKNQIYLGSDRFVEDMQCKMKTEQSLEDIPKPQKQSPVKPLAFFQKKYRERNQSMAEAYRSGHFTLKQIGNYFGVSYATVSRAVKKYEV